MGMFTEDDDKDDMIRLIKKLHNIHLTGELLNGLNVFDAIEEHLDDTDWNIIKKSLTLNK